MSPVRRKTRWWRGVGTAVASLPYVVADLFPRGKGKPGKKKRKWSRPRRIALALTLLVILGVGAAAVAVLAQGHDAVKRLWRLHDESVEAFRDGRYADVVAKCDEILDLNPDDGRARFNKGLALLKMGRVEDGMREIRETARTRPDFDEAHQALAQDALEHGDEDGAIAELKLVVANPPSPASAESQLAALLRRRGRDVEAMPHLEASMLDPLGDPVTRVKDAIALGRIHALRAGVPRVAAKEKRLETDCYALARKVADEALARGENDPSAPLAELHAAKAQALVAMGRPNEALVDADLALGAAKNAVAVSGLRLLRAQIFSLVGDAGLADNELKKALSEAAKPDAAAFNTAAGIYASESRLDRALEILTRGVKEHPDDVELGLARANMLFQTGALDEAEKECARFAEADPKGDSAWLLAGDVRRARDDLEGARKAYEEALKRRPDDVQAKLRVAGTAFAESGAKSADAEKRLAEAEKIATDLLAATPGDPGGLLALAKVRLARSPGRDKPGAPDAGNAEARKMLVDAVEADPLSIEARTFLAYADYLTRNDQDGAIELRRVLLLIPEERPSLRLLLAQCLLEAGAFASADEEADRVTKARPDDVAAWSVRFAAAWAARDFDGALESLKNLERLEPAELDPLFQEAQVLAVTGHFPAAEQRFDVADERARAIADESARDDAVARVAAARAAFYDSHGDPTRGRRSFDDLLDKGATTAAPFVLYAKFLLAQRQNDPRGKKDETKLDEAQKQIERGLSVEPGSVDARKLLCEIWFSRGEASPVLLSQIGEVERLTKGVKGKGYDESIVEYLRGKLAVLQGDLRRGKELLAGYVERKPDDPDGQSALGVTLLKSSDFAEAIKRFETAAALAPNNRDVKVMLAEARQAQATDMIRRGRVLAAEEMLRRAIHDVGDDDARAARALLVDALHFTGEIEASESEVRRLLAADPNDRPAIRMLAALQVQKGKLDDAEITLKRLCEAAGDDWTAWQFLSAVQADRGDLDAAEVSAKASRAAGPNEPGALAATLHVLVRRGDFAAAEKEIAAATDASPKEARYPLFLAMLRAQQERHEEAVAAAAKALDLQPATPAALQLAVQELSSGLADADRALAFARERAAKAPDDALMQYQLAVLESETDHRDAALAVLERACKGDLPPPEALALRGLLLLDAKDFAKARDALKKGLETYADAVDLHYLLAQSLLQDPANAKNGEPQEPARSLAVAELRATLAVSRNHAPALNNLAWLLSRDEPTRAEALGYAETAVRAYPNHAPYLDTWGTTLLRLNRVDAAVAAFRRALGACETERKAFETRAPKKLSSIETTRIEALKKRLAATTAEAQAHYDEALRLQKAR